MQRLGLELRLGLGLGIGLGLGLGLGLARHAHRGDRVRLVDAEAAASGARPFLPTPREAAQPAVVVAHLQVECLEHFGLGVGFGFGFGLAAN